MVVICDKVCQFPAAGRRFPPGTPVSSANKTDRHDITQYGVESDAKPHQTNKQHNILKGGGNRTSRHWGSGKLLAKGQ